MELQDPMVAFSIFSSVTITRGGTFVTLAEGLAFVTRLLKGFMIGFAIASGVSLFILPITSRGNVFHDIKGYVAQIDAVLQAQSSFVEDTSDVFTGVRGLPGRSRTGRSVREVEGDAGPDVEGKQKHLTASITKLNALHGKLQSDLFYSKDEIAWGKLSADDLNKINSLLRSLLLPLSGMAMLPEILDMIAKNEGTLKNSRELSKENEDEALKRSEVQKVIETLQERLADSTQLTITGLQYVLLVFELVKRKQLEKQYGVCDEESAAGELNPLQPDFAARFEDKMRQYFAHRKELQRTLAPLEPFSTSEKGPDPEHGDDSRALATDSDVRREFFISVYMGHLQENLLKATLDMINFAHGKIADGTMRRSRLIFPKQDSIRRWLSLNSEKMESKHDPGRRQSSSQATSPTVFDEDVEPGKFPDPEHLPPANIWEKGSVILRSISHLIKSEQSIFGFRVAAASFSVGILAFLHQTQNFFIHQRCIWAMIVIVIGMSPTSGQTMFGFLARIAATVISLVLSLIVWYIVDKHIAGVIVFLYLANVFEVGCLTM